MTDSRDRNGDKGALSARLRRYVRTARLWLFWERYAPVFFVAALFIGLFLIGTFSGIWERIGDPWRAIGLIVALTTLVRSAYRAQKRPLPTRSEARRRVEVDSRQPHRPLDVLDDHPALGAENWPAHYAKATAQAERLKRPLLRPTLAPRDRYFLRFSLPFALGLTLLVGGGANMERLRRAATPLWQAGINPNDVTFEAWIAPPDYTGRPPIYFKGQDVKNIPAGSEWVVRLNGAKNVPRPKLRSNGRTRYLKLNKLSRETFEARAILGSSGEAVWRIGPKRQVWDLNVVQDEIPTVTIDETPLADKQDRLVVTYSLSDDYGVAALSLEMAEIVDDAADPFTDSSRVSIPLSGGSLLKIDSGEAKLDLTRHPLAGKKVIARLVATDGANQSALSSARWFRVPDKIFVEPLAKAVVEQRAVLLHAMNTDYAPDTGASLPPGQIYSHYSAANRLEHAPKGVERTANLITAVTDRPDGLFTDPSVYLGLRNIRARLRYARDLDTLRPIPDELWSIALRAEYGTLGSALEKMREAEQALREGMARRAPQREIDTLFERYNNAVDAYTEELRRKALEEGNFTENEGGGGGGLQSTDEIQELLKAIEEANKTGDVEGARRALARLAEVLENMEIQLSNSSGSGGEGFSGEMSEEMKKNLEELADLLGEQRELQDETEDADRQENAQNGANNEGTADDVEGASPGELAARQEKLQELLGRLGDSAAALGADEEGSSEDGREAAGENGETAQGGGADDGEKMTGSGEAGAAQAELGRAKEAMSGAVDALGQGDFAAASEAQAEAIQALREAGETLAQAAQGQSESGSEGQEEKDPLGREQGGMNSENAETDIDPQDKAKRSRELMEELRRRAAEQARRKEEREYLERLLKRF